MVARLVVLARLKYVVLAQLQLAMMMSFPVPLVIWLQNPRSMMVLTKIVSARKKLACI